MPEEKTKQSQELALGQRTPIPGEAGRHTVFKGLPASLPPFYKRQLSACCLLSSVQVLCILMG